VKTPEERIAELCTALEDERRSKGDVLLALAAKQDELVECNNALQRLGDEYDVLKERKRRSDKYVVERTAQVKWARATNDVLQQDLADEQLRRQTAYAINWLLCAAVFTLIAYITLGN